MNSARHASSGGFTLLEVLVAVAIVSIAVFPLLQIAKESEQAAYHAKFQEVTCSRIRAMLSHITANAKPGDTEEGDFSTLSEESGFDERFSYASIRYEWEVKAVSTGEDLIDEDDEEDSRFGQIGADEEDDADIDARYRARYVKIRVWFADDEDESDREVIVETLIEPLPRDEDDEPGQYVPPNTGAGA